MKRLFATIFISGLLLGVVSCSDPNEDVFHNIDETTNVEEGTGGSDDGGPIDPPPPGGN